MLKMLFIDDDPSSVEDAIQLLRERLDQVEDKTRNFESGLQDLGVLLPDIVVLDVWKGTPNTSEPKGLEVLEAIWKEQFCPVIVYSADTKMVEQAIQYKHPFVDTVSKGSGSDEAVYQAVERFIPHVEALKGVESSIRKTLSRAMRDVAHDVYESHAEDSARADAIVRAGRRRVAALMDEPAPGGSSLVGWEQYLCPPISASPLLGDILRAKEGDNSEPESFRVVLTPSCDMVRTDSQSPRVTHVLVAQCCSMRQGLDRIGRTGITSERLSQHAVLTQGFYNAIVPFPRLQGRIPTMAANLRALELIPLDDIGCQEDSTYIRVASIDSPFRELISWAYMQTSCRPGLPDRELRSWSDEIIESLDTSEGELDA